MGAFCLALGGLGAGVRAAVQEDGLVPRGAIAPARIVQVTLWVPTAGGAFQVDVRDEGRDVVVPLHLQPGTTAHEAANFVAERLRREGILAIGPADGGSSIFIDGAERVAALGLGGAHVGLAATDGGVGLLRVMPLAAEAESCTLALTATTVSPHDGKRSYQHFNASCDPADGAPGSSARLLEVTAKLGWATERPGGNAWRPIRDKSGRAVVGLSISAQSGWQLELTF